jgi:hypothetical protein
MDNIWFAKQMLDFQKSAFTTAINAFALFQDQSQKVASAMAEQAAWLPGQSKRQFEAWAASTQKGINDYKKAVDDSFNLFEGMLCATTSGK